MMFAAAVALLGFASCSETWEDNPVLGTHEGDLVENFLNVPEMSKMAVQITEDNQKEVFNLVCSQPESYNYAASAGYQVEVSLSEDFATPKVEGAPASVIISTIFKKCDAINPTRRQVAEAICKMLDIKSGENIPTNYMPVYMRLHANVYTDTGEIIPNTKYTSNTVSFEQVSVAYLAVIVPDQPTGFYLRGGMNNWMNTPTPELLASYEFLTTTEADTYILEYCEIEANTAFKIASLDWGTLNLGMGDDPVKFGDKYKPKWNAGDFKFNDTFKGSITLIGKDKTWNIIFDVAEPDTPGQPSGIFLRGWNDNWDPVYEFMTTDVKNVWEVELPNTTGTSFKVADASWGSINLGGDAVEGKVPECVPGVKYKLTGSQNIPVGAFNGKAKLSLKGGKYYITLISK